MISVKDADGDSNLQERPVCSVCIANFNGVDVIGPCLDSVFSQVCDFPVEVIVHDDASRDGSVAFIRKHFPGVELIESGENVGFCVSNNRMVARARGRFVLLLNNDAALHPDALATLHAAAESPGSPAILGLPQYDMQTKQMIDIGSLFDPFLNPIPNRDPARLHVGMVIGACLWIPRVLWNELGGFPEWFGSLAEDMYLCCLARLKGYRVIALSRSGFDHLVGKTLGGGKVVGKALRTTLRRRALSERNKSFVMILTFPPPLLQFVLPVHLLAILVEGLLIGLIKRDMHIFQGIYLHCLKEISRRRHQLRRLRREAQTGRKSGVREFLAPFTLIPHKLRMLIRHGVPHIE